MYKESQMQTLERTLKHLKCREQVERLWRELRSSEEVLRTKENQLADLMDAVQEIVMFGATETGMKCLNETYAKLIER